ncbi:hypothetical protein JCM15765_19730 [Paradesulfitobacterium aromaticivorans]
MSSYDSGDTGITPVKRQQVQTDDPAAGVMIEDIQGNGFKGKVMLVKNPQRVKVAVTKDIGVQGEWLSNMVKDAGAVGGINAGGFYDPDGKGNGSFPAGITVHEGTVVHNNAGEQRAGIIGLNDKGELIISDMSVAEVAKNRIQEAVTFGPKLIDKGKPVVIGDGGWGIAPRTGIGQTADSTLIFVVIDGHLPTWSLGATLRDLMNVFLEYDAINAVNLDGGSSTEMVYDGKIINPVLSSIMCRR